MITSTCACGKKYLLGLENACCDPEDFGYER